MTCTKELNNEKLIESVGHLTENEKKKVKYNMILK